ncbi:MAG TPA: nuclease [Rhodoglobus sp.]|nr:nuclease [Rhodoglobus sp.]
MTNRSELGVLAIQHVVADASPGAWRDAIVVACMPGSLQLAPLDGGSLVVSTAAEAALGEPVAFHPVAEILSAHGERARARAV